MTSHIPHLEKGQIVQFYYHGQYVKAQLKYAGTHMFLATILSGIVVENNMHWYKGESKRFDHQHIKDLKIETS